MKEYIDEQAPQASTKRRYEVSLADLPLSCPGQHMRLWDSHPRVYLPIQEAGRVECPYCGAEYLLIEDEPNTNS